MPFPSAPYSPAKVDPTNHGSATNGIDVFPCTPFQHGSNWYFALYDANAGKIEVLKAGDDQITWTIKATLTVTVGSFRTFSDGTKLYIAYTDSGNGAKVTFVDFDMTSDTLGSPYGATGAPAISILGFFVRPQDTKRIVLTTNLPSSAIVPSWYDLDPGGLTWTGPHTLGTNVTNLTVYVSGSLVGVIDPVASVIHCFFEYTNSADSNKLHLFYQQIAANNTLGNFHEFGTGANAGNNISQLTPPILDPTNNNIIIATYDTVSTGNWFIFWGNGFVTPTWTGATLIDQFQFLNDAPLLQIIGGKITAVQLDGINLNTIHYWSATLSSVPTSGWSARSKIFDGSTVSGPWTQNGLTNAVIGNQAAGLFLYFGSVDPTNSFVQEYSLGAAATAAAVYHYRVLYSASLSPASANDLDWFIGGAQL